MKGRVEEYLLRRISSEGTVHLTLIDPERTRPKEACTIGKLCESAGTAAIMVGGSTAASVHELDDVVKELKQSVKIPIVLFPSDISGISRFADAVFFISLVNSSNPYYITGAQALGARLVKKYGLEPIPVAYVIVGDDAGAAGFIGQARAIPYDKPELAAIYSLASQYLGMRFVYLEAGSGAKSPVPPEMISTVKKAIDIPIIVGGGIRSASELQGAVQAGANMIVTGTLVEGGGSARLHELIASMKRANSEIQLRSSE